MRTVQCLLSAVTLFLASPLPSHAQQTIEIGDVRTAAGAGSASQPDGGPLVVAGPNVGVAQTAPFNREFQLDASRRARDEEIASFLQRQAAGSTSFIVQGGDSNRISTAILQSPGTNVGQFQLGNRNVSGVGVLGGGGNDVGIAQTGGVSNGRVQPGSDMVSAVLLVNSVGTQVIHQQTPASPYGGVVVINGVPGMRVILP